MYYAHSARRREAWEPLAEHLRAVAGLAAAFAAPFGAADEARAAGMLHDLGKYSDAFTRRLSGEEHGLDHWSIGAWAALLRLAPRGAAAALAVQGHHVGIGRGDREGLQELDPRALAAHHPFGLRLTESDPERALSRLAADGLALPRPAASILDGASRPAGRMLGVRMLFSSLVDADFLATEAHFQGQDAGGKRYRPEGAALRPAEALDLVLAHLDALARSSPAAPEVLALRSDLLAACRRAAELGPGLFTLSAPTGTGKTLAMLVFALAHAARHGLARVVAALPYLSILEQTAGVYRKLFAARFGPEYLVEHHSLAGVRSDGTRGGEADGQSPAALRARQLAENWDAPLVVTTTVQLLESLFANRPGPCRKLHRLARSVILLDEVQTLPLELAAATLAALSQLAERYGATVVLATATQPAFERLDARVRELAGSGWAPREIAPPALDLFARARRTAVRWRIAESLSWEALASEVRGRRQALVVVNLKRHALDLARLLAARGAPGLAHLSTNLCPAHRERVLAAVRGRLDRGEPCLLVATQCVEAGVDLDFPAVYRALAPLESIAQAAGRCNRNGRMSGPGEVQVFRPEDDRYPPGGYKQAAGVTASLFGQLGPAGMDLDSPDLFREYYRQLYEVRGAAEESPGRGKRLEEAIGGLDFPGVAKEYRLIDKDAIDLVVPYDPAAYGELRREIEDGGRLTAAWVRRARPHAVNLYRPGDGDPLWASLLRLPLARGDGETAADWFVLLDLNGYDRELAGLAVSRSSWIA